MSQINKEHKDRLFCLIFGREENKEWTLSLYNAINGSSYADSHLKQFLFMRKAEVTDMFLTEYNEEETMNMFKEEAYEQGMEQGIKQGVEQGIKQGVEQGLKQGREEKSAEYKKALTLFRQGASTPEELTSQGISEEVARDVLGIEQ